VESASRRFFVAASARIAARAIAHCTLLHAAQWAPVLAQGESEFLVAKYRTGSLLPFRGEQPERLAGCEANGAKVAQINGQNAIRSDPLSDCHHRSVR